jgi:hypothetical protein
VLQLHILVGKEVPVGGGVLPLAEAQVPLAHGVRPVAQRPAQQGFYSCSSSADEDAGRCSNPYPVARPNYFQTIYVFF